MKQTNKSVIIVALALACSVSNAWAQKSEETKESDRNVMLNASSANNTGPREVNIGLPASVGGTTVLENNLPVVYFFWPEMPSKAWRTDALTEKVELLDLGKTAINIGDLGFSVGTFDRLGSDVFGGNGSFKTNIFGLLNGDIAAAGPLGKGWKFAVSALANYDPGTFTTKTTDRYLNDQMMLFKAALTKEYRFGSGGKGSISALYKFADVKSMTSRLTSPYIYGDKGKVKEIDGFRIGLDSYLEGQKIGLKDAFDGTYKERDAIDDYGSTSHTLDLIGKNKFDNDLNFNYTIRLHTAETGNYLPNMTGIESTSAGNYVYADDGTAYTGDNVQGVMIIASRRTPIKSMTSLFELGKQSGRHGWKIGVNQWNYNIDRFVSESARYYQEVSANPRKLVNSNKPGNMYGNTDAGYEYHNGNENKTAIFITDQWDVTDAVTLTGGTRLEYQALRGDYIDNNTPQSSVYIETPKTKINKDFFNKTFILNGVFKLTQGFGLLAEATYNEQSGHLENYSAGNYPNLKQSKIPGGTFGIYYNHPLGSLVSKATYIQRDEYRKTVNFTHPDDLSAVKRAAVEYDIQTFGWTTDIVATPFKNFKLHLLFTYQNPIYKNYAGTVDFGSNRTIDYDFEGKTVNGISKVLVEIDPSYTWKDFRVWASARYFSKQYANLPNTLYFAGRWETFAGVSYKFSRHLDVNLNVVNLLNERGAQGSISGTDLVDEATAKRKIGTVMSGTYIRPFTVECGVKYRF